MRPLLAALLFAPTAVHAAPDPSAEARLPARAADIVAVMQGGKPAADVFGAGFLAAIPAEKLAVIVAPLVAQFGAVTGADEIAPTSANAARFTIRFERGKGSAQFSIDASEPYKVT